MISVRNAESVKGTKLRIGVDLDGVVYDFVGAFRSYLHQVHRRPLDTMPEPTCWDFPAEQWGMTEGEFHAICEEAVNAGYLFSVGDAIQGALFGLITLKRKGHSVHLVTSRYAGRRSQANTERWLEYHKVPYDSLTFTKDKTIVRCDIWIDDKPANVQALHDDGQIAYLFDQPWNRGSKLPRVVTGWGEFLRLVKLHAAAGLACDRTADDEVRVTDPTTGGQKGQKASQLGTIDPVALLELGKVGGFGANKYEAFNYLRGYDWRLSFDALQRHALAFWAGEDKDPESGLSHMAHAAWHALALVSFESRRLGRDTRPSA